MANKLLNSLDFDTGDTYLVGKVRTINNQAPDDDGNISVDTVPTEDSDNLITSGAVYEAIQNAINALRQELS